MIVRLQGGLGNQIFQLAFGLSLSTARSEPVFFSRRHMGRVYGLDAFSADVQFAEEGALIYREPDFTFDPNAVKALQGATFIGYWQTEKYFNKALVRQALVLRNEPSDKSKEISDAIFKAGSKSAFLHVRRGDYAQGGTNAYHGMSTMEYYTTAIERIQANHEGVKFFVFSDEPEWCRDNFLKEFMIVDHNLSAPHEDIWLMAQCKHAILANSSFSWWGCWLNGKQEDRMIFAPKPWFLADVDTRDLLPEGWVQI